MLRNVAIATLNEAFREKYLDELVCTGSSIDYEFAINGLACEARATRIGDEIALQVSVLPEPLGSIPCAALFAEYWTIVGRDKAIVLSSKMWATSKAEKEHADVLYSPIQTPRGYYMAWHPQ